MYVVSHTAGKRTVFRIQQENTIPWLTSIQAACLGRLGRNYPRETAKTPRTNDNITLRENIKRQCRDILYLVVFLHFFEIPRLPVDHLLEMYTDSRPAKGPSMWLGRALRALRDRPEMDPTGFQTRKPMSHHARQDFVSFSFAARSFRWGELRVKG